jgi:hypothetical protein
MSILHGFRVYMSVLTGFCYPDFVSIPDFVILMSMLVYIPKSYRPIALTSQILRVSSRCSLTISVRVQQPHTAKKLTILIQNYYKVLQNWLCLQKLYYA